MTSTSFCPEIVCICDTEGIVGDGQTVALQYMFDARVVRSIIQSEDVDLALNLFDLPQLR